MPPRRDSRWVAGMMRGAVVGLVATAVLMLFDQPKWLSEVLELGNYLCWLLLLASYRPLRELWRQLPSLQRRAILGIVAVMLAAQIIDDQSATFPFMPFTMYSHRLPDPVPFFEYVGTLADGREIRIPASYVFRSQHRTYKWRMEKHWLDMQAESDATRRVEHEAAFRELLKALIDRFNARNPETQVRRVRMVQGTTSPVSPGRQRDVTRQTVFELAVE